MESGKVLIVALVFVQDDKGVENPTPIVIGPFKDRVECFKWEAKTKKERGISRIEVKNVIPL